MGKGPSQAEPAAGPGRPAGEQAPGQRLPEEAGRPASLEPGALGRNEAAALRADALAVALRGALDATTVPLARAAAAFVEARGWNELGYARLEDHARERFGRSGRWVSDLAAPGRMFSTLPGLEAAVAGADGGRPLGRVAALVVGRVASPASLEAWLVLARQVSVRELKDAASAAREAGSEWPVAEGGTAAGAGEAGESRVAGASRGREDEGDDGDEARSLVRIAVPRAVAAAFDEALDLYRAVEGREATVTSFVEALVAEASSSGDLADPLDGAGREALTHGEGVAAAERAHARSTGRWRHLPGTGSADWALRLAGSSLERLRALQESAGRGGPVDLDAQIRSLAALEDEIETRLGALLAQMADDRAWVRLRFDSHVHYGEERLGLRRSAARMRVRVARALKRLPVVRQAYERGEFGMESAWLVAVMIGDEPPGEPTQRLWVGRAARATVKRLRDEARLMGRRRAGIEEGEASGGAEGGGGARSTPGPEPFSDADWYAGLRREAGMARRRVAALGRIAAAARGSDVFLTLRLPDGLASDLLAAVESARRGLEGRASEIPWDEPWPDTDPTGSLRAAREAFVRCRRTPAWAGLLALLEQFVETWDPAEPGRRKAADSILVRDGWRCVAPGCTSRRNLEEHHSRYRSRGGGDEEWNRLIACRFHHQRGEHGGLARCRGRAPLDLVWRLGRDGCGGAFHNEMKIARA